ncbi:polymerase [Tupavirus incomtus]|uniref:Replicase n=1 Tax=Tupavirus sp. TaxID=2809944 RepID=A0AAE9UK12_9RHAB|nr:polymerase [Tupavirus sp.]
MPYLDLVTRCSTRLPNQLEISGYEKNQRGVKMEPDADYDWETSLWEKEEDLVWGQHDTKGALKTLRNVDYNLNSPLLRDEIDAFLAYVRGQYYPPIFYCPGWEASKSLVREKRLIGSLDPDLFHPWVGRYLQRDRFSLDLALKVLRVVETQARATHEVQEAFFEALNIEVKPFLPRLQNLLVVEMFARFLDFHILVIFLNHHGDNLNFLRGLCTFTEDHTSGHLIYTINLPTVGLVYCTKEHLFVETGVILNRNLLLMVKDTTLARFQTAITMTPRHDGKFREYDVGILQQVYHLGDQMLVHLGCQAYDHLKFLEPICNLRLTELARTFRPRIPDFPSFREFLDGEIEEASHTNFLIKPFSRLIMSQDSVDLVIQIFGCFRHWGHPYIDYFEGLQKLHEQVTMTKDIDDSLAQALASDLAYLVLRSQFKKHKRWFVDLTRLPRDHPFYTQVMDNTWPTPKAIEDFGDSWHLLPLLPCFDIPDLTDPSLIYSDKSHSVYRDELVAHVANSPHRKFPTRRVLNTFLETPARDWKAFLQSVNDEGLPRRALCIGLRPKERELKRVGRFFALMSWELREYFVFTEYLIKEHYIPLFQGLTMADDMTGVIKKLLDSSHGQGLDSYELITISNHLDYSKWNNHQRLESNVHVFRVMGEFLGYPNLIARTHEFFRESLVYFINRPDLMVVAGDTLENATPQRVCWNGQDGGLEGLRQKGWSILNLLLILRLGKLRNTEIKVLAQGDNQVLNMHYKLPTHRTEEELDDCIGEIVRNNNYIMGEVDRWTLRLGLVINKNETMQSADFLIYGKVPIFRGNVTIPESKRWSRVNCVTNDQLPTFANVISTVSSTALTVSHFSNSFVDPIESYNYLGNLARVLVELFNPILGVPMATHCEFKEKLGGFGYLVSSLYLDPSLGGICGMSLTRFLIRNFPDPVTEGLAFWKIVGEKTRSPRLRTLSHKFGNPRLSAFRSEDLIKLMEKPESLNIPNSISAQIVIRTEVREILRRNVRKIQNHIVADAVLYGMQAEEHLLRFLSTVKPLFPRFLAEFKAGTYLGLTESLVGLYENSKSIRNRFLRERERELDFLVIRSEVSGIKHLISYDTDLHLASPWRCSSSLADELRSRSWGDDVIGATIPHPIELLKVPENPRGLCAHCREGRKDYLTTFVKREGRNINWTRGPYLPYLGSRTSETTSLLTPWEKETTIPLIKRAARLRSAINWFIQPDSNLGQSILNNLRALTGEDPGSFNRGFLRTGSAIHRFSSSRQSSGGYSALSPAILARFLTTTDTLGDLGDENYDFMFQSLILFSQSTSVDRVFEEGHYVLHHHLNCRECIRPITEPILDSQFEYRPIDVSNQIRLWIPSGNAILETKVSINLEIGDWARVPDPDKAFHVGRAIGFIFSDAVYSGSRLVEESSLFPNSIRHKLNPPDFYRGLLNGLLRGCAVHITHRRNVATLKRPRETLVGSYSFVLSQLSNNSQFINLIRDGVLHNYLLAQSHRTPPSYPLSKWDLGGIFRHVLKDLFLKGTRSRGMTDLVDIWVFADLIGVEIAGPLVLSTPILKIISKTNFSKPDADRLRELKSLEISLRNKESTQLNILDTRGVLLCPSEVRHAVRYIRIDPESFPLPTYHFGKEVVGRVYGHRLLFNSEVNPHSLPPISVPRYMCPVVSGLRTVQLATGAHYKVRSIFHHYKIGYRDFLCGGDGSGGLSSLCLRWSASSRGIFNSLLLLDGYDLRGSKPSLPSAICALGTAQSRCVNLHTCWEEPSDLTLQETWENFIRLRAVHRLKIDLMIFDMENKDDQSSQIESLLAENFGRILERGGSVLFKSYVHRLQDPGTHQWISRMSKHFQGVYLNQTEFTSSFSSEVYLLFHRLQDPVVGTRDIDLISLDTYLRTTFVYADHSSEFRRARGVAKLHLDEGIPQELLPNNEIELSTGLEIAGVESGRAATLSRFLLDTRVDPVNRYWTLKVLLFDSFSGISSRHRTRPDIPSDNKLLKALSFFIGMEFWWAVTTDNQKVFSFWTDRLHNDLLLTFAFSEVEDGFLTHAFFDGLSAGVHKRLRLQGQSAPIGSALRTLHRCIPRISDPRRAVCWRYILAFNKGLSLLKISRRSNLLDYIKTYRSREDVRVSSEIVNSSQRIETSLTD